MSNEREGKVKQEAWLHWSVTAVLPRDNTQNSVTLLSIYRDLWCQEDERKPENTRKDTTDTQSFDHV